MLAQLHTGLLHNAWETRTSSAEALSYVAQDASDVQLSTQPQGEGHVGAHGEGQAQWVK